MTGGVVETWRKFFSFHHFSNTSFVVEEGTKIAGFLVGFLSQSKPDEAYVHFIGVHPNYRRKEIASMLYKALFEKAKIEKRRIVRGLTSPLNKLSLMIHPKLGFSFEPGDKLVDGVPVHTDYDGKGKDRVLFYQLVDNWQA